MNKTQLLATLYMMRTNTRYQHAETLRRNSVVADMAKADMASEARAAISLLIGTWEAISVLVLDLDEKDRDFIFKTLPVLYMFTELSDAIEILSCKAPGYAENFRLLSKHQAEWLKYKDDHYQTGEQGGMHALFG